MGVYWLCANCKLVWLFEKCFQGNKRAAWLLSCDITYVVLSGGFRFQRSERVSLKKCVDAIVTSIAMCELIGGQRLRVELLTREQKEKELDPLYLFWFACQLSDGLVYLMEMQCSDCTLYCMYVHWMDSCAVQGKGKACYCSFYLFGKKPYFQVRQKQTKKIKSFGNWASPNTPLESFYLELKCENGNIQSICSNGILIL